MRLFAEAAFRQALAFGRGQWFKGVVCGLAHQLVIYYKPIALICQDSPKNLISYILYRMGRVLTKKFFDRSTIKVSKELLGKFLVRKDGRKTISATITEVEAYVGQRDLASHASRGKTERTKVMFGKPGQWYVYLIYGMYCCLNIVTEREEYPAAILIRGVEGISGPGRVCKYFKINKKLNEKQANKKTGLWIEDRGIKINPVRGKTSKTSAAPPARASNEVNPRSIKRGKRVGVDYAGAWKHKLWRFYL